MTREISVIHRIITFIPNASAKLSVFRASNIQVHLISLMLNSKKLTPFFQIRVIAEAIHLENIGKELRSGIM